MNDIKSLSALFTMPACTLTPRMERTLSKLPFARRAFFRPLTARRFPKFCAGRKMNLIKTKAGKGF